MTECTEQRTGMGVPENNGLIWTVTPACTWREWKITRNDVKRNSHSSDRYLETRPPIHQRHAILINETLSYHSNLLYHSVYYICFNCSEHILFAICSSIRISLYSVIIWFIRFINHSV